MKYHHCWVSLVCVDIGVDCVIGVGIAHVKGKYPVGLRRQEDIDVGVIAGVGARALTAGVGDVKKRRRTCQKYVGDAGGGGPL
jgi:hypothetical protein